MYLPGSRDLPLASKSRQESAAVLLDVFEGVFVISREIQVVLGKRRDTAQPCREPICKSGVLESTANKDLYLLSFSPEKARIC